MATGQMERFGPTRRGGPVFRWLGEPLALDLANTVMVVRARETVDLLATAEDLARWLSAEGRRVDGVAAGDEALEAIRELREPVRGLLGASARGKVPADEDLEYVNAVSASCPAAAQLIVRGGRLESVEAPQSPDPLARLLGAAARSAIAVVTGPERERLHVCDAPSCGMFFIGARRWCCAACGNRARVARHGRRRR